MNLLQILQRDYVVYILYAVDDNDADVGGDGSGDGDDDNDAVIAHSLGLI